MPEIVARDVPVPEGNRGIALTLQRMLGWVLRRPGPRAGWAFAMMGFPRLFRGGTPEGAERLYTWVTGRVRFVRRDQPQITTPEALLEQLRRGGRTEAICAEYVTLLAHLAHWLDFPVTVVVVSQNPERLYDHVYLRVGTTSGWLTMDPTLEAGVGAEMPAEEITARWEIPVRT